MKVTQMNHKPGRFEDIFNICSSARRRELIKGEVELFNAFFYCLPQPLLFSCRPLYSTTMLSLSLCFTGFRDKEEMVSFPVNVNVWLWWFCASWCAGCDLHHADFL